MTDKNSVYLRKEENLEEAIADIASENSQEEKWGIFERISEWYFRPREFERKDGARYYERLGVHHFKKLLPTGGDYFNILYRRLKLPYQVISSPANADLKRYERATRRFERIHIVGGIRLQVVIGIGTASIGIDRAHQEAVFYEVIAVTTLINTLVNIYPIMVQRYNRARIYNILEKREKKERSEKTRPVTQHETGLFE